MLSEDNRVVLRRAELDDLDDLIRWDNDPRITRYIGKQFENRTQAQDWLQKACSNSRMMVFMIERSAEGSIGSLQVRDINWRRKTAELRIFIGEPALWSRGLGTEAIRLVIDQLVTQWNFGELYLRVDPENRRARRAYEKCGFQSEGLVLGRHKQKQAKLLLMTCNLDELRQQSAS